MSYSKIWTLTLNDCKIILTSDESSKKYLQMAIDFNFNELSGSLFD